MQLHVRMAGRDPGEAHRASTPLELFFDLTFVVAVSQAASGLHHGLVEGHAGDSLVGFPLVFFGIWWAWMNFTWFASAYDTDDDVYRITGKKSAAAGEEWPMTIKIMPNDKGNPPGKLADAEVHFAEGTLEGLKLIGFSIWERRGGGAGRNVTFPARSYAVNGERRNFALLRPITAVTPTVSIRGTVLAA